MRKVSLLLLTLLVSACFSATNTKAAQHKESEEAALEWTSEGGFDDPINEYVEELLEQTSLPEGEGAAPPVVGSKVLGPVRGIDSPIYKLAAKLLEDTKNRITVEERKTWSKSVSSFEHKFNGKIHLVIGHSGTETQYDEIINRLRQRTASGTADDKLEEDFAKVRAALESKCGGKLSKYTAFVKLSNLASVKSLEFQAKSRLALVHCEKGLTQVAFSNVLTIHSSFKQSANVNGQEFGQFAHRYFQHAFLKSFSKECLEEFVSGN